MGLSELSASRSLITIIHVSGLFATLFLLEGLLEGTPYCSEKTQKLAQGFTIAKRCEGNLRLSGFR